MEPISKTLEDYVSEVSTRFNNLSEPKMKELLTLYGTPQLVTISQVLGPEISSALGSAMNSAAQSLQKQEETTEPTSDASALKKGGLVIRRSKKKK